MPFERAKREKDIERAHRLDHGVVTIK